MWSASRPSAYGAVPSYRPLPAGSPGSNILSLVTEAGYRNRITESVGLIWLGANWYDPVSGQFVSPDPMGHDASPSLYSFCGGDPLNQWDADGRCGGNCSSDPYLQYDPRRANSAFRMIQNGVWRAEEGVDAVLNFGLATLFTPEGMDPRFTVQQGGNWLLNAGAYIPSQNNEQLQQLSADLSGPTRDVMMAYGALQSGSYSPQPQREMQWGAPLNDAFLSAGGQLDPLSQARAIVNASGAQAGGFEFYNASPNAAARQAVQGQYVNPLNNQVYPTTEPLAADHFIPQVQIRQMPGFSQITSEQQDEVLNNLANFQGLPQTFNSSKQGQSPGGWTTYKGKPLDPGYIQRNIQLEPQIRSLLQQQINGFINQNNQKPN